MLFLLQFISKSYASQTTKTFNTFSYSTSQVKRFFLSLSLFSHLELNPSEIVSPCRGYNNPPTARDSLLPIASTNYHGEPLVPSSAETPSGGGTGVEKKNNKRRKPSNTSSSASGGDPLNGMSKSAYR